MTQIIWLENYRCFFFIQKKKGTLFIQMCAHCVQILQAVKYDEQVT